MLRTACDPAKPTLLEQFVNMIGVIPYVELVINILSNIFPPLVCLLLKNLLTVLHNLTVYLVVVRLI